MKGRRKIISSEMGSPKSSAPSVDSFTSGWLSMGKTTIELPNKLEREFRAKVAMKYGGKKGGLGMAVKEAIELWLKQHK